MTDKERVQLSKFLSLHLRHTPEALGLTLDSGGWVAVADLLAGANSNRRTGPLLTQELLEEVVRTNDKQRFAFDETGTRIRAQQGHSQEIDLELQPQEPPAVLYHGTVASALPAIWAQGLLKMKRHHVHLSPDVATAQRVGSRRGAPVVLVLDAAGLHATGAVFYKSGNGVWLTDQVPPEFLRPLEG
ncbi:RNA 2'-phosphotransferase [Hymenobacter seoulensis]